MQGCWATPPLWSVDAWDSGEAQPLSPHPHRSQARVQKFANRTSIQFTSTSAVLTPPPLVGGLQVVHVGCQGCERGWGYWGCWGYWGYERNRTPFFLRKGVYGDTEFRARLRKARQKSAKTPNGNRSEGPCTAPQSEAAKTTPTNPGCTPGLGPRSRRFWLDWAGHSLGAPNPVRPVAWETIPTLHLLQSMGPTDGNIHQ